MSGGIDRQLVARQVRAEKAITAATVLSAAVLLRAVAWTALRGSIG